MLMDLFFLYKQDFVTLVAWSFVIVLSIYCCNFLYIFFVVSLFVQLLTGVNDSANFLNQNQINCWPQSLFLCVF